MSIPVRVVLASDDLLARARVLAAAGAAGADVHVVPATRFAEAIAGADVLIIDLDAGRDEALTELTAAGGSAALPPVVVGFVSHVDGDLARAAREAGVRAVARGRFWAALPDLLRDPARFDPSSRSGGRGGPPAAPPAP
ncbi:MAG TPA: hypothetical protein VG929_01295 [Actinomycetota bacterium]|nr:hypothetical protein [Actinomycetota bacterium]